MRSVCETMFKRLLKPSPGKPNCYIQSGQTMVMVESDKWKLAYSQLERVTFDISDEHALIMDVPGDHGVHLVPWHVIVRITITDGAH